MAFKVGGNVDGNFDADADSEKLEFRADGDYDKEIEVPTAQKHQSDKFHAEVAAPLTGDKRRKRAETF